MGENTFCSQLSSVTNIMKYLFQFNQSLSKRSLSIPQRTQMKLNHLNLSTMAATAVFTSVPTTSSAFTTGLQQQSHDQAEMRKRTLISSNFPIFSPTNNINSNRNRNRNIKINHSILGNQISTSINNHQSRLYGTNSNGNDRKENLLTRAASKLKSILPWNKKKDSKLTKKQQAKDSFSTSIDTALKDAPLGVRMIGKMIKPLIGNLVGKLAQAVEESQQQMEDIMGDVSFLIQQDTTAVQYLGYGAMEFGTPFSQSSSTMSINGKAESRIQASFEVRGDAGAGVATMIAVNGQIESLILNVEGRDLPIDTTKRAHGNINGNGNSDTRSQQRTFMDDESSKYRARKESDGIGKNHNRKEDDIIDAEFVDKVSK